MANKTLCIAEWEEFGIEEILGVLKSSEAKNNGDSSASPQNDKGEAHNNKEVAHNDRREAHNDREATYNDRELAQNDNELSHKELAYKGEEIAQNDELQNGKDIKNNDEKSHKKLLDKAQKIFAEFVKFAQQEGNHQFLKFKNPKTLKAQNYAGLIQVKSGFCVEILPKTFRAEKDGDGFKSQNSQESEAKNSIKEAKQILLSMLKTLRKSPFKKSHISTLKTHKFPLLEIFAIMFLDEVERLIKKGIKSDYVAVEQNRHFLKGKLLWTQNLKYNFAHKERFFTQSDEFISDIAPNRLIVSTLLFLSRQNFSLKTDTRIKQSRFVFETIKPSQNISKDFAKSVNLRHYKSYELVLLWCKIFLKQQSFLQYFGKDKAFALLFDMNKLFESFVASHLRKCSAKINFQEKSDFLLKCGEPLFKIKPDIVCKDENKTLFIADTKWKIISSFKDILQADLYQIFAYLATYQCEKGILIYPKIKGNENTEQEFQKEFSYKATLEGKTLKLKIHFFDVSDDEVAQESALKICEAEKQS